LGELKNLARAQTRGAHPESGRGGGSNLVDEQVESHAKSAVPVRDGEVAVLLNAPRDLFLSDAARGLFGT
jgi:hypothetical protein